MTDHGITGGSMQLPFVRFAQVAKSYDGVQYIVRDLDLDIARGEFLTLLGPSGSGKTTTLMMLAGFEVPTSGEIYLAGEPLSRKPPHERGIGMVFQNYALFPHMTVAQNVAFPLEVRKTARTEIAGRVAKALDMVRLPGLGDRKPAQLSGGQQQRVALARALVFEPSLVLMDEPLGALDKQLREQMQYEIRALHERLGITFVYVTHDQGEALTMSDRIAVFASGRIRQLAGPSELYERPADAFVATFIGETNSIRCRIVERIGERATATAGAATLSVRAADCGPSGAEAVVMVRPERVMIDPDADCANRFDAEVRDVIYHGDHLRVALTALGTAGLIAKVANAGRTPPAVGSRVTIGFSTDDALAFAPEPAKTPPA
jgi:putative spermidine/putrescine transport system ATP-binding protein